MNEQDKYNALLQEIGALLQAKNDRIMYQDFEIANLRKNLTDAEHLIDEIRKETQNE